MRRDFDEDRLFTLNPTTENCTLQTNITDSIRISTEPPANATDPTFVWRIECGLENASLIIDMMKPTYLTDEMIRLHVLSEDDCNMKFSCEVYGRSLEEKWKTVDDCEEGALLAGDNQASMTFRFLKLFDLQFLNSPYNPNDTRLPLEVSFSFKGIQHTSQQFFRDYWAPRSFISDVYAGHTVRIDVEIYDPNAAVTCVLESINQTRIKWTSFENTTQNIGLSRNLYKFELRALADYDLCVATYTIYSVQSFMNGIMTVNLSQIVPMSFYDLEFNHTINTTSLTARKDILGQRVSKFAINCHLWNLITAIDNRNGPARPAAPINSPNAVADKEKANLFCQAIPTTQRLPPESSAKLPKTGVWKNPATTTPRPNKYTEAAEYHSSSEIQSPRGLAETNQRHFTRRRL
ncbi:uncharacterized protein LOC142357978 [Convolutriloba macropyga]|uniref:uncharacterized protein LOC142357978 n=1 Tax=Convolutriloba macropyga TaxID=536237 RepID=UPI003F520CBF